MNHTEQPNEIPTHDTTVHFGIDHDDMSMLNQVLQQVKGISCVSCSAYEYEIVDQPTAE